MHHLTPHHPWTSACQAPRSGFWIRMPWLAATILLAVAPFTPVHGYGVFQTLQHQGTGFGSLDEAASAMVSPDGRHVYVVGLDAVTVFERDNISGSLSPVQILKSGLDGFDVLFFNEVVISPDGSNVYASSTTYSALVVFSRNQTHGRLEVVESLFESSPGIEGLNRVVDIELTRDGKFLYSLAFGEAEIGIFRRDVTTGALTFVDEVVNDEGSPQMMFLKRGSIAPDGKHFYVADSSSGILVFSRETTSGGLTIEAALGGGTTLLSRPLDLIVSPDGDHLYASGQSTHLLTESLVSFARDSQTGQLNRLEDYSDLENDEGLVVSPSGDSLYLTADSFVTVFSRDAQGHLSLLQVFGDEVDGLGGSQAGVLDPQGNHLYVPSFFDEAVAIFERAETQGELSFLDSVFDGEGATLDGLVETRFVRATNDGNHTYLYSDEQRVLAHYRRNASGNLSLNQSLPIAPPAPDTFFDFYSVLMTPDESNLILVDTVKNFLIFRRDPATGHLSFLRSQRLDGIDPFGIDFSQDSRFLYARSFDTMRIYAFDGATGDLTFRAGSGSQGRAQFVRLAVSPTGRFFYGTSGPTEAGGSAKINTFEWDELNDSVTFIDEISDPAFGGFITDLEVSLDGRFLYATGADSTNTDSPGLVIFERQIETGGLTKIQSWKQGNIGPNGSYRLGALSHSGTRLMIAGQTNSIQPPTSNFFERDPTTGLVTLLEQRVQGDGKGPADIRSYLNLTWSPAGDQFYVSSELTDRLYAFDEDVVGPCVSDSTTLCLGEGGRFKVEVNWTDFVGETGLGTRVVDSADSGLFWFFERDIWEMLVKVINGCENNGHHWVFAAATTNVAYTLTVTDTLNNKTATYENRLGESSPSVTDNEAFATCP